MPARVEFGFVFERLGPNRDGNAGRGARSTTFDTAFFPMVAFATLGLQLCSISERFHRVVPTREA